MTDQERPSARDLVRKRRGTYKAPDTGRHHHLGGAPQTMPVHDDDGVRGTETTAVQLASRTVPQLQAQRERLAAAMAEASAALDFERAAAVRDDLVRVDAELARRG
ncbi:MAG TPA: UvrB/UvrC motif-containing protein [Mycobacteriales bacterium]|nr:UvrB/UvrC motif-containing protein [Mycobacteriales bacterium]